MIKSCVVHARIEPGTKASAERVLRRIGLSPTEAIRIFYRQIALRRGIPFSVEIPNAETRDALQAARKGRDLTAYRSVDEMAAGWAE